MFSILEVIPEPPPTIRVLDIGAMSFGAQSEPYSALQKAGLCRVVGFEPVKSECEKLNQLYKDDTFLPYCLGDGSSRNFYVTNHSMTSSLYEPDTEFMARFEELEEYVRTVRVETMQTHRLADIKDVVGEVDYIKNDTQGAEGEIFSHAGEVLDQAVVVHTEVEFEPLYRGQPLFSFVDSVLRRRGFMFHKFINMTGRRYRGVPALQELSVESQQLWADAVYVRHVNELPVIDPEKLLKLAIILHEVYQSYDLCYLVLSEYDCQMSCALAKHYAQALEIEAQ